LNSNLGYFGGFTQLIVSVENHVYLSRGVQVTGAAWRVAMSIVVGVGDLVQRTGNGRIGQVLGGRVDDQICQGWKN
jgi:hypothetical protein